jgi:hypothetical protein
MFVLSTHLLIIAQGIHARAVDLAGVLEEAKKMRADRGVGEPRVLERARP